MKNKLTTLILVITLLLSQNVYAFKSTLCNVDLLRPMANNETLSLEEYLRSTARGSMPRPLKGPGKSYANFVEDFFPSTPPLDKGLIALLDQLEEEARTTGEKWVFMDGGGGIGFALKQAIATGNYPNMVPLLVDAVNWGASGYSEKEQEAILAKARELGIEDPWTKEGLNFLQAELSPSFVVKSPKEAQLRLIMLIAVLGFMPDPLGSIINLYNQLPPGGCLLAQLAIPMKYPKAKELSQFYSDIFQDLEKRGVGTLKVRDCSKEWNSVQGLPPTEEFMIGIVLTKSRKNPLLLQSLLEPQVPKDLLARTERTMKFKVTEYSYTGDPNTPFNYISDRSNKFTELDQNPTLEAI